MIPVALTNQLKKDIPYIINSYGGISNFIVYAKEFLDIPIDYSRKAISSSQYQELLNYFYTLFKYKNNILVVSPWSMYIDLTDKLTNILTNNSINPIFPYQVFDIKGNLKYTVKNHFGVFGESRLDENLLNKAVNGSIYFIKYKTYNGNEKVKLLLINLFSKEIVVSNSNYTNPLIKTDSTITIIKNSNGEINTYFINTPPIRTNNININNFRRLDSLKVLNKNNPIYLNINNGGWLLIEHNGASLNRTEITNINNDILIQIISTTNYILYYIGLNIDVSTLNQYYNKSLQYTNKPITEIITIS